MTHVRPAMLAAALMFAAASAVWAQLGSYSLETIKGLTFVNAAAEPVTHEGKRGLRVTLSDEAQRNMRPDGEVNPLAVIQDLEFSNGVIEAEIAGAPAPNAGEGARGFVGIAFRMQKDNRTYDAFYLRPTNGRADDQVQRSTSRTRPGHGSGSGRRHPKSTKRTWTSCRARGRR